MDVSIAGFILAALIATLCLFGRQIAIFVSICAFAFPSTAIVTLTSLGGASITIPQFGLGCLSLTAMTSGDLGRKLTNIFKTEISAKLLALFVLFALAGAYIMPRLFQDVTEVFSLARGAGGKGNVLSTVPLAASSGNITQPFYFLGNVAGFFSVLILCQRKREVNFIFSGLIGLTIVHIIGGGIDFISKYGAGFDLLDFLRTAKYAMLVDVEVLNFKRIVGLYPEASTFAYASIAYTALMFGAWRIIKVPGGIILFFAVFFCLSVSTSSTAYFCIVILLTFYILALSRQLATGHIEQFAIVLLLLTLVVATIIIAVILVYPKTLQPFQDLLERMVLDKADSESARQRFGWNMQAVTNFLQTGGMGAGLGSLRSSSWPLTLIAELGVIGLTMYGAIILSFFFTPGASRGEEDIRLSGIAITCQIMIFATLVAATASSALFDLGAPFYVSAGCIIAARRVERGETLYLSLTAKYNARNAELVASRSFLA